MPTQNKHPLDTRPLIVEDLPNGALTKSGKEAVRQYYEWQTLDPHDALNIGGYDGDILLRNGHMSKAIGISTPEASRQND